MIRRFLAVLAFVFLAFVAAVYFRPLAVWHVISEIRLFADGYRHHHTKVGPHRIHYFAGGEGPPLVLVHGLASRSEDWAPVMGELAEHHRVYALDLLGYGDSDRPRDAEYSIAMQSEIVRGFLDALGLKQADVMGVSMGGWIALKLAADHPERVRRLVLVSSAGFTFETSLKETSFTPATLNELREILLLQTDQAAGMPGFVARDFLRKNRDKAWIIQRSMRSMLARRDILEGKLQRVRMPVLIVWGTADRVVPYRIAGEMQSEMPQSRVVPLDGCGHLAIIECKEKALPPIVEFLSAPADPTAAAATTAAP